MNWLLWVCCRKFGWISLNKQMSLRCHCVFRAQNGSFRMITIIFQIRRIVVEKHEKMTDGEEKMLVVTHLQSNWATWLRIAFTSSSENWAPRFCRLEKWASLHWMSFYLSDGFLQFVRILNSMICQRIDFSCNGEEEFRQVKLRST